MAFLNVTFESTADIQMNEGSVTCNIVKVFLKTVMRLKLATIEYVIGILRFSMVS